MTEAPKGDFAKARGLTVSEPGEIRELTPALVRGSGGEVPWAATGELAGGLSGTVCHLSHTARGDRHEATIVLTTVPETVAFLPALAVRDREELGSGDPEQLPAERWERTELESGLFNERYRLFTLRGQDAGYVRELFTPRLIEWLAAEVPAGFSFELNEGNLAVILPGSLSADEDLEHICGLAAEVAQLVREEAAEEDAGGDVFDESAKIAAVERVLPLVEWPQPPASVQAAIAAYRAVAMRKPSVLLTCLMWFALTVLVVGGALALVTGFPLFGLAAGVISGVAAVVIARPFAAMRYRWGDVSVQRVSLEAFTREYAKAHHLRIENRWRWHAEHRGLALPGFADTVMRGEQPGMPGEGDLAFMADAPEMRSRGEEIAYVTDRPLASSAIVADLGREIPTEVVKALDVPKGYSVETQGSTVCVWRPIDGNLLRTSQGTENFRRKAGAVIGDLAGRL